jgi:hypothetical protein
MLRTLGKATLADDMLRTLDKAVPCLYTNTYFEKYLHNSIKILYFATQF